MAIKYKELIYSIFKAGGLLQEKFNMEHRPEQERLALKFADMFENDYALLAEGGTGVGKSLAYLIPGVIWSLEKNRKFIVSTHTRALQEQILKKEIPFLKELFSSDKSLKKYKTFKECVWMGRNNYLCGTRLKKAVIEYSESDDQETFNELLALQDLCKTKDFDGIRSHIPFFVSDKTWDLVNADSPECNSHACKTQTSCYYKKSKKLVEEANLVIANHTLVLQHLRNKETPVQDAQGILFKNDMVVLDEGHTVADVCTEVYTDVLSKKTIESLCARAISFCRMNGPLAKTNVELMRTELDKVERSFNKLFDKTLKNTFKKHDLKTPYYILRTPGQIDSFEQSEILNEFYEFILKEAEKCSDSDAKNIIGQFITELGFLQVVTISFATLEGRPNQVYWLETNKNRSEIKFESKPLSVAEILNECFFNKRTAFALTSATLADAYGKTTSFRNKVGADLNGADTLEIIEKSPFDYEKNMEVVVAKDCPEFNVKDDSKNIEYNCRLVKKYTESIDGGTLVLCTSYSQCEKLSEALKKVGTKKVILTQYKNSDRNSLIKEFREDGNAILIGTQTFWTGIDVQGKALSQVIILKMPFENPSYPLIAARYELEEKSGKMPFFTMAVPNAVMNFRQGLGRLIRSKTDKGRLVISDSRLLNKTYGKAFFNVIPKKKFEIVSKQDI